MGKALFQLLLKGEGLMTKRLERLMKISFFLSIVFLLIGIVLGILGVLDHNIKILTSSSLLVAQSVLLLINIKIFRKIWGK